MSCPNCGRGPLAYWSDSGLGSYGEAYLDCTLFVWTTNGEIHSSPLDLAPFPRAYRNIPRYRAAVGWVGP